jgi:hypothetical protein
MGHVQDSCPRRGSSQARYGRSKGQSTSWPRDCGSACIHFLLCSITLSPVSQAAKGLVGDRGLSLRFPRFIRVREDKAITDASGPEFLAGIWRKQEGKRGGADEGELVDAELDSGSE